MMAAEEALCNFEYVLLVKFDRFLLINWWVICLKSFGRTQNGRLIKADTHKRIRIFTCDISSDIHSSVHVMGGRGGHLILNFDCS